MTEGPPFGVGVTIVIPTHERPRLVRRLLAYYATEAPELPIVVADSSAEPSVSRKALRAQVTYWHCPGQLIAPKLHEAVLRVRTQFTMLCPDDYLILPSALQTCSSFLLAHDDFAAVEGISLALTRVLGRNVFTNYALAGLRFNASASTALARVDYLLDPGNYYGLFYSCQRTQTTQRLWSLIVLADLRSLYLIEYVCVALLAIFGKAAVLPTLHALITGFVFRRASNSPNIHTIIRSKSPEYLRALALLARAISEKDGLDPEICFERLNLAFERFNARGPARPPSSPLARVGRKVVAGVQKPFYLLGQEELLKNVLLFQKGCGEILKGPRRARRLLRDQFNIELADPPVRDALDAAANRLFAGQ
jgi:glycosyltransferase domain-containing protein